MNQTKCNTLAPITLARPIESILCGGYTTEELLNDYSVDNLSVIPANLVPSITNLAKIAKGESPSIFKYPWDIIIQNKRVLNDNLKFKVSKNDFIEIGKNVFVGRGVQVSKKVEFISGDEKIIVIDNYSQISPFVVVEGPAYIGKKTIINSNSIVKHSSIGNSCKVGGEVESSVISNFTNKQHFGFIGHSYVGEWVNLGAGTSNSDLKNTYGEISIDYQNQKINTGQQFLGCVISDFVKTAINTTIFTGNLIGFNTHLYGVVASSIPSFVNFTHPILRKNEEFRLDEALKIQKRMFERRGVLQTIQDIELMKSVFVQTKEQRDLFLSNKE